jgi:hypothetical protein
LSVLRHATGAVVLVMLTSLFSPALPPAVAVTPQACSSGWTTMGLPDPLDGLEPHAVATVNGQPAWIVGLPLPRAKPRVPMIGRWTGSGWAKVPAPWRTYGVLNAVEALSSTNAWVVGARGTYTRWPIAAHWDGSSWTKVKVPKPNGQLAVFTDLAVIDSVHLWTAGARLINGRMKPVVMFHNARRWRTRDPSIAADVEAGLAAVTVAPGGQVWAGGWQTDADGQGRPWVIRRVGTTWQTTPLDSVPAGRASIMDFAFSAADDGWAAGFVETTNGYQPILQHWNGQAWSAVSVPWSDGQSILAETITLDGAGRLYLGGIRIDELRADVLAVLDHGTWSVSSVSSGSEKHSAVMDLAPVADGAVAVGFVEGNGTTWLPCSAAALPTDTGATPSSSGATTDGAVDDAAATRTGVADTPDTLAIATQTIPGTIAVDMTQAAGLDVAAGPTWSGVVGDFNGDGWDDIFVNHHYETLPQLLLNSASGVFSDFAANFTVRDRHGCDAADVNGDGRLDLFCTIGVNKGTSNKPNELILSPGYGGTWASREFGVMDGFGRGRDVAFLNLGGDSYPDAYVVNEASRSDGMWSSNRLYANTDGTGFVSAPEWGVDHPAGFGCVTAADLNGDKADELIMCTTEPTSTSDQADSLAGSVTPASTLPAGARVYFNENGQFVDRTAQLGILIGGVRDIEVADFNGDGRLDLAELNRKLLQVSLANADGTFSTGYQLSLAAAVAMAVGDVNGDGRPDIYIARATTGNSGHLMLVNGGDGTSFISMTIPEPGSGHADDVIAIDYDHNGRTDFVTFNGSGVHGGPVNLLAFYPD